MVRGMESAFGVLLSQYTNLILKRPQHANILQSLSMKVNDKIEKYFHNISNIAAKLDNHELKN